MVEVRGEPRVVGRRAERARLEDVMRQVSAGECRTVVIGGEAGIGKTHLIEAVAARARADGFHVLAGACLEFGSGGPPYHPFVEALRALVRETEPGRLPAILGPGRVELARLLPELDTRGAEAPIAPPDLDRNAQARLFEIVLGVLERLARARPLVLVVEDLHWADASTRDLLAFLIRGLRASRALVLVTVRTEELRVGSPVLGFLAELQRDEGVERLELGPFGRGEVADLLELISGQRPGADEAERFRQRTDGNPFFIEQLVAATREAPGEPVGTLSPRLHDVLLARVGSLREETRDVLRAAAASGRRVDDRILARAAGLPEAAVQAGLREALSRQILVPLPGATDSGTPAGFAFRHTLLREVVYGELLPGERSTLHAGFARELADRPTDGDGANASELAYHWDAAGDRANALAAHAEAGRAAERVYAHAEALRHYERALELWSDVPAPDARAIGDRASLHLRAAEMAVLSGAYARAVEHGRAALASVDPAADPGRVGVLNEHLRWFLWEAGDRVAAMLAVEEALRLIPHEPPTAGRARALAHLGGLHLYAERYGDARASCDEAVEVARAVGPAARAEEALALGVLGWVDAVMGDIEGGLERFRSALAIARELGSIEGMALGYANLAALLDRVGRSEEAVEIAREGVELTQRLGLERTYGLLLLGHLAKGLLDLGRWDEAERATAEGLDLSPTGRAAVWLRVNRGRLDVRRGRFGDAAANLAEARRLDDSLGATEFRPTLLAALAELAVWAGRPDEVVALVDEGLMRIPEHAPPDPGLAWLATLTLRAAADLGERARARRDDAAFDASRELAARVLAAVERVSGGRPEGTAALGGRRGTAIIATCRAEWRRLLGEATAADWAAVADAWDAIERPFPVAYARYREAEATLVRRGQRGAAETALRAAWSGAVGLGAVPLRAEVELLARQARIDLEPALLPGAVPPVTTAAEAGPGGEYGFTARELEVLRLVAGGWTNQQIADALFISKKTASVHVSNILGKLAVDSRVEAAAIAHRLGLGRDAPPPPDAW